MPSEDVIDLHSDTSVESDQNRLEVPKGLQPHGTHAPEELT
jgi:hypothetical protein